mmetsp:Transcript_98788/g.228937  ORF Transcript_98788/g.228937 Transcript_98788/m.228937 type:complete len:84 (+) Transcript_98788:224-475(+)
MTPLQRSTASELSEQAPLSSRGRIVLVASLRKVLVPTIQRQRQRQEQKVTHFRLDVQKRHVQGAYVVSLRAGGMRDVHAERSS